MMKILGWDGRPWSEIRLRAQGSRPPANTKQGMRNSKVQPLHKSLQIHFSTKTSV